MNIVFIAAGPYSWASSRLRAYWVAEELRKKRHRVVVLTYDEYKNNDTVPSADVYIWQKTIDIDFIKANQDKKHYWDVCDPIWWFSPEVEAYLHWIDGVVCSTQALADDFKKWAGVEAMPVVTIPDRLNLAHSHTQKKHSDWSDATRFIWYGVAVNRQSLYSAVANLERLKANGYNIELTIMDDRPDVPFTGVSFPVYHVRWSLENEVNIIASHDIALLPPYPGAWGRVKSNNKKLTAWACGLPVTDADEYGDKLIELVTSAEARGVDVAYNLARYNDYMDIRNSAKEWEAILC